MRRPPRDLGHMEGNSRLLGFLAVVSTLCVLAPLGAYASRAETGGVVVTRDAVRVPEGCAPRDAATRFMEFFSALEGGEVSGLRAFFAEDDPPGRADEPAGLAFRWYSVTEGGGAGPKVGGRRQPLRHFVAYDVAELLPYFAERQRQHERMELVAVEIGTANIDGAAGGTFVVRREADDLEPGLGGNDRIAHGKFVIACAERRFFVWSMGMNMAPGQDLARTVSPCPLPRAWAPAKPAVACTRGRNARALAGNFTLGSTSAFLPGRCRPAAVKRRVVTTLAAFNTGLGADFGRQFVRRGQFHPYTASIGGTGFVGAKAMRSFVHARYTAGDGWTATALRPPTGSAGLPAEAVYTLELEVSHQGARVTATATAKLVVDCGSGKLRRWAGPALSLPGS